MLSADVLIIGGGPAGLSAALTLVRQNHPVLLFDSSKSRAMSSSRLYGVCALEGIVPVEYFSAAIDELAQFPNFVKVGVEIADLKRIEGAGFQARDSEGNVYEGKKVILANGVEDCFPDIEGYAEAWGKAIFHNPFAQGIQSNRAESCSGVLAVDRLALPVYAMHLTHLLSQLTAKVTIYTHGDTELASTLQSLSEKHAPASSYVNVDGRRISRLHLRSSADSTLEIFFEDGTCTTECFIGHAPITKINGPFAEQLGINLSQTQSEYMVKGPTNTTNVDGVYAAGDAIQMFKVWPNAIASGAVTAAGVAVRLQEEKWGLRSIFG